MTNMIDSSARQPLIAKFDGTGQLRSFLYRVAGRRISREVTRRRRLAVTSLDVTPIEPVQATSSNSSADDVTSIVTDAFTLLTEREVLLLRLTYQNYTVDEIGHVIGCDPGHVSRLRSTLYAKLRTALKDFSDDVPQLRQSIVELLGSTEAEAGA